MNTPARSLGAALLGVWLCIAPAAAQEISPEVQLNEVRRLLLQDLDYERALALLEQLVPRLERATDDASRTALVAALSLRAQTNFNLGSQQGAADDFARVLTLDPGHVLPATVSPRLVTLFDDIRKTRVGTITLVIEPPDATVQLDGRAVASGVPVALVAGEHQLAATRPGYRPYNERLNVGAGIVQPVTIAMERVSAAVTLITSPPGVEVFLNGTSRGRTVAGPLPAEFAELPARLGVNAADIAAPMVIDDLAPGSYNLQFRRACFQNEVNTLTIDSPRDVRLQPIVMKPAVATLRVDSSDAEATVYIDNQPRGAAPLEVQDLCEGDHVVELRSPGGRYRERITAQRGGTLKVSGVLKPAFALISVAGLPQGYRGQDLRLDVERALRSATHVTFIAPEPDILRPTLEADQIAADSLSFDLAKRAQGAAARMTPQIRRAMIRKISQALDVQGVATITVLGGETGVQRMAVSLFASGASEPDVVLVDLQDVASLTRTIETLDYSPAFSTPSLGMLGIDVADAEGVVVARVDPGGPAATAGLKVGERVFQVFNDAIKTEADLARILEQRRNAESLPAFVADRDGNRREVALRPVAAPRVVSVFDQTLPFNTLAAQWRARLRRPAADADASLVRLNLAVAAYRIGDFETARDELEKIQLPSGPGISQGTVQYLLGLAYEGLTDIARARQAFQRAAEAEGATLSDQGGRIPELAKQKLAR
jgi:tetratricopeptide (TPR) repeat protein